MSASETFQFTIGPAGNPSVLVGGEVRWGDGGWLVEREGYAFQAPPDMSKTEAILRWLATRLGTHNDGSQEGK